MKYILASKKENHLIPRYEIILFFISIYCVSIYKIPLSFAFCTA